MNPPLYIYLYIPPYLSLNLVKSWLRAWYTYLSIVFSPFILSPFPISCPLVEWSTVSDNLIAPRWQGVRERVRIVGQPNRVSEILFICDIFRTCIDRARPIDDDAKQFSDYYLNSLISSRWLKTVYVHYLILKLMPKLIYDL